LPTLVLATSQDVIHPIAHAAHLARLIPNATLTQLTPKGVDQLAHVAEFHAALRGFLKDL
jgi:pimeloyl-ACP methyl ester carboxylesterase